MGDPPPPKKQRILDEEEYQALLERVEAERARADAERARAQTQRENNGLRENFEDKFHLTSQSTWAEWRSQGPGSSSSVSASYATLQVQFVRKYLRDFVLPLELLNTRPEVYIRPLWPNGTHKMNGYGSEGDIQNFTVSLLDGTIDLLKAHPLARPLLYHSEKHLRGVMGGSGRVDISLMHSNMVVGLCEVKKPWITEEEHQTALKQLFAYLCSIELSHRRNTLGLLSTANKIQICWLGGGAAEEIASAQSLVTVPARCVGSSGAHLCYTEPVQCTDRLFMQALCSFVLKCAWSSSMASMEGESEWCCVYEEMDLKFPRTDSLSRFRPDDWNSWSELFQSCSVRVVKSFSPGGDGFAQLIVPACNKKESDPTFEDLPSAVVKFFYTMTAQTVDNDEEDQERITYVRGKTVDEEVEKFNQVNSHLPRDFQAFRRAVRGVPALIMPYCTPILEEDFRTNYAQNLADFIESLREKRIAYTDLKLAHLTTFEGKLTLIDTCRVTLRATDDQLQGMQRDHQNFLNTLNM